MFTIKAIDRDGQEMFIRHGARPGEGPIVRYATRAAAERDAAMLRENVGDEFQSINVVVLRRGQA
jgi:hypothetical protein